MSTTESKIKDGIDHAADSAKTATEKLGKGIKDAATTTADAAHELAHKTGEKLEKVGEKIKKIGS